MTGATAIGATAPGGVLRVRCGHCGALLEVTPAEDEHDNEAIARAGWVVVETPDPASELIWSRWYCSRFCAGARRATGTQEG